MDFTRRFLIKPGRKVKLNDHDPEYTGHFKSKEQANQRVHENAQRMYALQERLYAEGKQALLIVLQAMDTGGKDGTIRHVMSGVNPQNCRVTSFKAPSSEERSHDYLWRIHRAMPVHGSIGIFNRSHYEDVLIVRVHNLVPRAVWRRRYGQINAFERLLADNDITILKFFLHISRAAQKARLQERLDDPSKNWKTDPADFEERKLWPQYMAAYEDALARCSTAYAPWYVIPADHKWFRNLDVSQIIVETLERMNPKYPKVKLDLPKLKRML